MRKILLIFFLLLPNRLNSYSSIEKVIVWNVGQGQWVTASTPEHCLHIDMGGEKPPLHKALKECFRKKNRLVVSHPDYDHISFINRYSSLVTNFCLVKNTNNFANELPKYIKPLNPCKENSLIIKEILWTPSFRFKLNKNDMSSVFTIKDYVLVPGDSTKRQEKFWSQRLNKKIKWLVLGHHGSNTSTSKYVLNNYRGLVGSIVSARFKKYKHPHKKVVKRLQQKGLPVISTELWGNIHIYL